MNSDNLEGYSDGIAGKPPQRRRARTVAQRHAQDAYIAGHCMGVDDRNAMMLARVANFSTLDEWLAEENILNEVEQAAAARVASMSREDDAGNAGHSGTVTA